MPKIDRYKGAKLDAYERAALEKVLAGLREISGLDKTPGYGHSGDGYANALGRANGLAKGILPYLETVLGVPHA